MEESKEEIREDGGGDAAASGSSRGKQTSPVPKDFLCPISLELMREPVVISSGETYDRASIKDWLDSGNKTCPITKEGLFNTPLIPNHLVQRMIFGWWMEHGIEIPDSESDPEVQENAVTTILNLSLYESNKKIIGEHLLAVQLLINALEGVTMEARAKAAAALSSISASDSVMLKIVEMGAMKPLVELLHSGSPSAKKDAGSAIFNLCMLEQNQTEAIRSGAVEVLLQAISNQSGVVESMATLKRISNNADAAEKMYNSMTLFLDIIKDKNMKHLTKWHAVKILYNICQYDQTKLDELQQQDTDGCISELAKRGSRIARGYAASIVSMWNK